MQYRDLKDKAKKMGIRVTKDINGKRVPLSGRELRKKIRRDFDNSIKNAQKVIYACQAIVGHGGGGRPPPPPPPPPPPKPKINSARAKLMKELKNTLKKRGLSNK